MKYFIRQIFSNHIFQINFADDKIPVAVDGDGVLTTNDQDVKSKFHPPIFPKINESFEGDGFPSIQDNVPIYHNGDDRFYWFDDEDTITISDDTNADDRPLYQNQEGDPEVQKILHDEMFA